MFDEQKVQKELTEYFSGPSIRITVEDTIESQNTEILEGEAGIAFTYDNKTGKVDYLMIGALNKSIALSMIEVVRKRIEEVLK